MLGLFRATKVLALGFKWCEMNVPRVDEVYKGLPSISAINSVRVCELLHVLTVSGSTNLRISSDVWDHNVVLAF